MKRILYICDQSPFGCSYGGEQRTNLIFQVLTKIGHVDLVCFSSESLEKSAEGHNFSIEFFGQTRLREHSIIGRRILKIFNFLYSFSPYSVFRRDKAATRLVRKLINTRGYDLVVIRYIRNAFFCGLAKERKIIVDVDDLPEQTLETYVNVSKPKGLKLFQYLFYIYRTKYHINIFLRRISHSFFTDESKCILRNSSYLPNIPFHLNNNLRKDHGKRDNLVIFVGSMFHNPNKEGVEHFIKDIWTKVKTAIPDAVFNVIGGGLSEITRCDWEKYDGVKVLGYVTDLKEEYKKSKIVVVPVYYGSGSNIKVLEALSYGMACVISEFSAKPFRKYLKDNYNILIGRDNNEFAGKVISLLKDEAFGLKLGENGYRLIADNFSFEMFSNKMIRHINP